MDEYCRKIGCGGVELAHAINLYIGNTGNLMFLNGCKYVCEAGNNEYAFYDWYAMHDDSDRYKQRINEEFDLVIYPLANILQENTAFIKDVVTLLRGIKIPVYCMGIGISLNRYDNLRELCSRIKEPLKELINIVDDSGGKFACRGYITQEVLERVWGNGSNGRVSATGCPSMYQNGLLHIEKAAADKENFRAAVNGRVRDFQDAVIRQAFSERHVVYVCQDEYCNVLYGENNAGIKELIKKYSYFGVKLLSEKRVCFFYQLPVWYQWVSDNVDFMFGSRIHGNLIALLAGKPAMVYLPPDRTDLRVRELVDFFKIPSTDKSKGHSLYDLYRETDYKEFERNFEKKFMEYEKFLRNAGIVKKLERNKNAWLDTVKCHTEKATVDYEKLEADLHGLGRLGTGWYRFRDRF